MNISREALRGLSQLASIKTPIEATEFRELLLRHLISNVDNGAAKPTTGKLIEAYNSFSGYDNLLTNNQFRDTEIQEFYDKHWISGYNHGCEEKPGKPTAISQQYVPWPSVLPRNKSSYPKDVIAQFAAYNGYKAATGG